MRSLKLTASICIFLVIAFAVPRLSFAQFSISTIAGGGPNGLPATQSSIGYPESVALDGSGNIYLSDSYSNQVFKVDSTGKATVVAGNGTVGYAGDGGPATSAALNGPERVLLDGSGNLFIADTGNFVIREVLASTGNIQTVAGNGKEGYAGDGGPATKAELDDPYGVFVDGSGNIFIADTDNFIIRCVAAVAGACGISTSQAGYIYTVAGTPGTGCTITGQAPFCGDGGSATSALTTEPEDVFVDGSGNIFIADTFDSVIRVVNPGSSAVTIAGVTIQPGDIEAVAGLYYDSSLGNPCQLTGDRGAALSAYLCQPGGVFVDASENIFIADTGNFGIRCVAAAAGDCGISTSQAAYIYTVAGTLGTACANIDTGCGNGGLATSAQLNYPSGLAVDSSEDVYIADTEDFVVRNVAASNGDIQAFAGNNFLAYSGDGGIATSAELNIPGQVFVDSSGNVFIADSENSVIREVVASSGDIQTVAGNGTAGYSGDNGPATAAELYSPYSVFVDSSGNIFIADTENCLIRKVSGGTISTVVGDPTFPTGPCGYSGDNGPPTSAQLYNPYGVTLDSSGNIFIADSQNSAIRVVNTGSTAITLAGVTIQPNTIATLAGNGTACVPSNGCGDGGAATSALLNFPGGLALDATENIFIADSSDDAVRVVNTSTTPVTIAGVTIPAGDIQTVVGTLGQRGYSGDGVPPPASVLLDTPSGVYVDSSEDIFIADEYNNAVREVVAVTNIIQTIAGGNSTEGFSGDGGPATSAALAHPLGVVGVASGNFFVADTENSRVRELSSTAEIALAGDAATVPVGGSQQFLATVTGANNSSVTWEVNRVPGGNSTWGKVSSTGLYTAPATVPTPPTVTVSAVCNANGFTKASVQVTIGGKNTPTVSVTTTPSGVTDVYTGTTQTFNATVTNETNTAVNWQVNAIAGGNSTVGTISGAGAYTAPSSVPSHAVVLITAVSQANTTVWDSYPILVVTPPSATANPKSQTISAGSTAKYSLALNANTGDPNQPITFSCVQSTLPTGATCTFSPASITPKISRSTTLTVTVPSGTASLQKPRGMWLTPPLVFAFIPLAGIFLIGGKPRNWRGRWLWIASLCVFLIALNACGGGSSSSTPTGKNPEAGTYTIQVQGTTTAQPTAVTITTVVLIVQ